jgi:hypothetical protein
MTFIITVNCNEGIVMAADSRLTIDRSYQQDDKTQIQTDIMVSDAHYKIFLAPNDVGISVCGAASVMGVPLAGYVERFIDEQVTQVLSSPVEDDGVAEGLEVDGIATQLLKYFRNFESPPDCMFHVAGYKTVEGKRVAQIWRVRIADNTAENTNENDSPGAIWGGETDIIYRLIQSVYYKKSDTEYAEMPPADIAFQYFTLQDAIDFAVYAVRSTVDTIRFLALRPKTVGGPIDVLVIKPREAKWVQRKELGVSG